MKATLELSIVCGAANQIVVTTLVLIEYALGVNIETRQISQYETFFSERIIAFSIEYEYVVVEKREALYFEEANST